MPEWKQRIPKIEYTPAFASITEQLGYINGIEDVDTFLNPRASHQHDPYLLMNIEEASAKIISVIDSNGRIAVSADVDGDGISSAAMMHNYLLHLTPNVYITYAERTEGHGIENQLDMIEDGTKLVVICDSSSGENSIDACKFLQDIGIDVIILDHHPVFLDENNNVANTHVIMVNPQQPDCTYPNKQLSGVGVVYKVIKVMNDSVGVDDDIVDDHCLPLVAVGLCADMMDVTNMENRYLISQGLKRLIAQPDANPGLTAILKVNKVNTKAMNSQVIGFTIGPMLNGAARMGNIKLAIDLLTNIEPFECATIAKQIKALNDERKVIEKTIFNSLLHMVDENDKVIVVYDDDIGKSFNGLVATKLATAYKRPAIVFRRQGKFLSGSYRGVGDVNMREVLKGCVAKLQEEYCDDYGFVEGHEQAGGIGIDMADLGLLKKYLNDYFADTAFETAVEYDLVVDADDVTDELIREVERFNYITGQGLPQSKFLVRGLEIVKREVIGKNVDTVKYTCTNNMCLMKFRSDTSYGVEFQPHAVPNEDNPDDPPDRVTPLVDVVGSLNINSFYHGGLKRVVYTNQVFIEDIKAC